jgi:hypothetical protein
MMVIGSQKLIQQLEHTPSIDFIGKTLAPVSQVKDLGTTILLKEESVYSYRLTVA